MIVLLNELNSLGRVILFGSFVRDEMKTYNDIDIALILKQKYASDPLGYVSSICKKLKLVEKCRIQYLYSYEKQMSENMSIPLYHILYCLEEDILECHPISKSLTEGLVLEVSYAA